ncbi:hypothetical protein HHI36_016546 [Cryptolaemus montrouzieri]|uniref:WW domain-containing protein n=1 Tax=Cryptolaemus montrouzieri TaxID=559131 RepID=A0ABD2NJT0_9CUCU
MDSTLNDFFNEINEIVPLKNTNKECEWKECFDAKSGFTYYWNTRTDEVTWDEPKNFIPSKVPTTISPKAPICPSVLPELINKVKDPTKIYKISPNQNTTILATKQRKSGPSKSNSKSVPPKIFRKPSDSDDEKITLISSYGSESESEDENENSISTAQSPSSITRKVLKSDDEDSDILSTVRKRAEELKRLDQPDTISIPKKKEDTIPISQPKTSLSGFSLVAGYDSNSEEEEEESETENIMSAAQQIDQPLSDQKTVSHSTLFPIVEPPNVNDFIEKVETEVKPETKVIENIFDTKNFQRKRRLGVTFIPTQRNTLTPPSPNLEGERKGFGFNSNNTNDNATTTSSKSFYSNFTKGGVEFTQSSVQKNENANQDEQEDADMKQIEGSYEILHEKLAFLCEGNKDVMPVQIILIQIETLFGALKANSLKPSYLHDWLEGTSEDLLKLEKEAAPEGWLLQWDRSQKRYYYHNQSTGEGRWDYPQSDVRHEEAMDICTTPPPPEEVLKPAVVEERPPLPPSPPTRSPSPPPPPIISQPEPQPIPEPPAAPQIVAYKPSDQPLPPGVDYPESTEFKPKTQLPENDDINSAFDSFYSELAAIESTPNVLSPSSIPDQTQKNDVIQESSLSEPPKKKKKKVKLGQGLSMKKKDVSKLVEKWKNVQKNY